jgi:hypothetical protein
MHEVEPTIARTGYRHGIDIEDTLHAYRNAMYVVVGADDMDMAIGPASDGRLLEIGFIRSGEGEVVILHSMPARKKFLR